MFDTLIYFNVLNNILHFSQSHLLEGQYKGLKEVQETSTTEGKRFELRDTGIVLEIPQEAIEDEKFPKSVGMRIIPSRKVEDEVISFCSNSSVAVELFPSGFKLRQAAKLYLPHCLVFKETKERGAKIFINHEKGSPSPWKKKEDNGYTLKDDACIISLLQLCCVKYSIDDAAVKGKKITVYTAAKKVVRSREHAEVEVGYHSDIPDGGELLRMNPHFVVDTRKTVLFMEDRKSPLKVSLESIATPKWECIFPKEKQREITFKTIASSMEHSHLYILQNTNSGDGSVHCIFQAWQKTFPRETLALTGNQQV
ncbi:hypothetical protein HOLleu_21233 [Holothuria leucospilota]|uniref:Uncharacterized protein n=1 Tax=Holothuria leucospilota TaxID=206669 RepID=A0A9Q1H5W1_HOLLE|nr:hypothetical protein HOLleu_21233 [Holothuria leucospilota]